MTKNEAISAINGFTQAQIAEFNLACDNKVYDTEQNQISQSDLDEVNDVVDYIDSKEDDYINNNINPSLNAKNKLSGRPC